MDYDKYSFGWSVKMSEMSQSRSEERHQESSKENCLFQKSNELQ